MVDVSEKPETARDAVARGEIRMNAAARRAIRARAVKKGDPLQTARLAGIMAAKRTAEWIPLCHPVPLTHVDIELTPTARGYVIVGRAATMGRTGVEMEALTAVAAAALTLYDMLKAVDRAMTIGPITLLHKRGGRSGEYSRGGGAPRA
jgi:cyclic pyranopterin phosphate synthase